MFAKIIQSTANLASRPAYSFSIWANVPKAPADPVLGVAEAFKKDTDKNKVNLGVGAYRNNEGKPWVLDSVRRAEEIVYNSKMDNEYLPVEGLEMFRNGAAKLAYTENNKALKEGRIATV
mmetsp:Transcript_73697/g.111108  ORF Transcript_73697/g.111108 Transcript_73697/m.111108 type:complete len:120 (-) Transcript_73697:335-694(-)